MAQKGDGAKAMAERDLYAELGLKKGASKEEIKKAYRKLARELHPDRNPDNPKAEERFKRVAFANDVLGDERKRGLYDEFGEVGLREGFDAEAARAMRGRARGGGRAGGGFGFEEIFARTRKRADDALASAARSRTCSGAASTSCSGVRARRAGSAGARRPACPRRRTPRVRSRSASTRRSRASSES